MQTHAKEPTPKQVRKPSGKSRGRPWKAHVNIAGGYLPVRMLSQSIEVGDGHQCRTLWDSGSQATLVTHEFARRANLMPVETEGLFLMGLGDMASDIADKAYDVPLPTRDGQVVKITAHALESLTSPLQQVDLSKMSKCFPEVSPEDLLGVSG